MNLDSLRDRIDGIDARIVNLLAIRLATAKAIGRVKSDMAAPIVDQDRESRVRRRVKTLGRGRIDAADLDAIYRLVIRMCARAQKQCPGARKPRQKRK